MPKKKIFDIIPPPKTKAKAVVRVKEKTPAKKPVKKFSSSSLKKILVFIIGGVFLTGALSFFLIEPETTIEIWPETEPLDFGTEANVLSGLESSDFSQGDIKGEVFSVEKSAAQEFSSSGTKLKTAKAKGIITIYNTAFTYSQPLVANTRFISANGKLFRIPERVVVPGGHYEGGKFVSGSVQVGVAAGEPGPEYNIGPSTFSIPGFAGTPKYTAFYAKSFESMAGGMRTEVKEVTQGDLDNAKKVLQEKVLKESELSLMNSLPSKDYIIAEEAISQEVIEIAPLIEKGQELDKFILQMKAQAKAVAVFKESELKELAKATVLSQLPQGKELKEDSLTIKYVIKAVDLEKGRMSLDLAIAVIVYPTIDQNTLKEMVKDKNAHEIGEILSHFPGIKMLKVSIWPFWARRAAQKNEKIEIKLNLD